MTSLPLDALVVVADGEGARVFRNRGEQGAVSLHQYDLLELMNMNDDGPARSMPGESTSRQLDEATFAKQLANGLNEAALKQQYEHLVLVADPTTLGRVRPLLHKEATQRLLAEVGKDLTNVPLENIERAIAGP
ncbi:MULTISPECIES: host attachment family protein [unclassified Pseudoxanthomonas]|uniref:host attachment family protein n=1 Tax=unclassified Pseudoxanthomonas TaxID=2645906 RepID=UPI0008EF661B|nr:MULTISPECIES: host attachment family protein [unclassified Pseudoxanthomonas]PPJ41304.1 host attachment protein [Pseudoxanthomonas sp. KAs_5_3]SFV30677.1 Protein required for attachment to host cells [Pseudoxanthomonas sp. YR558]